MCISMKYIVHREWELLKKLWKLTLKMTAARQNRSSLQRVCSHPGGQEGLLLIYITLTGGSLS